MKDIWKKFFARNLEKLNREQFINRLNKISYKSSRLVLRSSQYITDLAAKNFTDMLRIQANNSGKKLLHIIIYV